MCPMCSDLESLKCHVFLQIMASSPPAHVPTQRQLNFDTPSTVDITPQQTEADAQSATRKPPQPNSAGSQNSPEDAQLEATAAQQNQLIVIMRQQLAQLQQRVQDISATRIATPPSQPAHAHQSREYWAFPISNTAYPGEDANQSSKNVYRTRLDTYLHKTKPIWDVVSGEFPCPIISDQEAILSLKAIFGADWEFDLTDITGTMSTLQRHDPTAYTRVKTAMELNDDTTAGSWGQRNSAIYSTICDTMDLSKTGTDLDILDLVEQNNGVALYDLIMSRLRKVQSSDPMARAIKIKMGIDHIVYVPKPHGVDAYFAAIKHHRSTLACLPKPKHIDDWEVVAKAIQDLSPLHPKFEAASRLLELQRQMFNRETSLIECVRAFSNAEADNQVYKDLGRSPQKRKRKLTTNLARQDRRNHDGRQRNPPGTFKKGDCTHHPWSTSHTTIMCINPFGYSSTFGRATDHISKCEAVKISLAAGWSPKATHVKVPEGFGSPRLPAPGTTPPSNTTPPPVRANVSQVQQPATTEPTPQQLTVADLAAYNRVQSMITRNNHLFERSSPGRMPRRPHISPGYPQLQRSPMVPTNYPQPAQLLQHRVTYPMSHHSTAPATSYPGILPPATPLRTHFSNIQQPPNHMPSEADLIAAGMQYFQQQVGSQDFHSG